MNAYSPTPFNPNKTNDDAIGRVLRPNQTPGVDPVIEDSRLPVDKRFNPDAFVHSTTEHGNLGRNSFGGFSLWQVDLGLRKHCSIAAKVVPQISGELFNVLRHSQLHEAAEQSSQCSGRPVHPNARSVDRRVKRALPDPRPAFGPTRAETGVLNALGGDAGVSTEPRGGR